MVSMSHIVGCVVRRPTFGLAGCTRSRGRRQPNLRTKWYQVEREAPTVPSRCAKTASVPVGTCRSRAQSPCPDRRTSGAVSGSGRRVRTGRPIVKRTRMLQASPGMEPTRGQAQKPQEHLQGNKRTGTILGSAGFLIFGVSVGQPLVATRGCPVWSAKFCPGDHAR